MRFPFNNNNNNNNNESRRDTASSSQFEPLAIVLVSELLVCRGLSGNLEPALLSGHIVLKLSEVTNIKNITLDLIGKARIPLTDARYT
jgi:hypothetical protein